MEGLNYSLATLYNYAIESRGAYKKHIGSVVFGDYKTMVMTQTGALTIGGNEYSF